MQLNVGKVDENGTYTREFLTFAIAGFVRSRGEVDSCLNGLLREQGLLTSKLAARRPVARIRMHKQMKLRRGMVHQSA